VRLALASWLASRPVFELGLGSGFEKPPSFSVLVLVVGEPSLSRCQLSNLNFVLVLVLVGLLALCISVFDIY
jgi:hypothetical protein